MGIQCGDEGCPQRSRSGRFASSQARSLRELVWKAEAICYELTGEPSAAITLVWVDRLTWTQRPFSKTPCMSFLLGSPSSAPIRGTAEPPSHSWARRTDPPQHRRTRPHRRNSPWFGSTAAFPGPRSKHRGGGHLAHPTDEGRGHFSSADASVSASTASASTACGGFCCDGRCASNCHGSCFNGSCGNGCRGSDRRGSDRRGSSKPAQMGEEICTLF